MPTALATVSASPPGLPSEFESRQTTATRLPFRPSNSAGIISGPLINQANVATGPQPPAARHLGTTAIESAQPGDVIVMEQRTGIDAACWGGNLSLGAKLRQVAGVIVDGPARDIDEAREYDFPIFARSTTSRTARGRIVETATNVAITVGDVTVSPGDFVVADGSGIVFVAQGDVERMLAAAEAVVAREHAMVAALRAGTPISQVMGIGYETMLKK